MMTETISVNLDSDIDIFAHTDPDAKICGPHLSDSCSNSDYATNASGGDGGNDDGACCSDGYNEGNNNEEWALWNKNNHEFCMIPFQVSSGYKPSQNEPMPISTHEFYMLFLVQLCLKK
jgi:hypothetical protein